MSPSLWGFPLLAAGAALFIAAHRLARAAGWPPKLSEQVTGRSNTFWGLLVLATIVGLKVVALLSSSALPVHVAVVAVAGVWLGWLVVLILRSGLRKSELRAPKRRSDLS